MSHRPALQPLFHSCSVDDISSVNRHRPTHRNIKIIEKRPDKSPGVKRGFIRYSSYSSNLQSLIVGEGAYDAHDDDDDVDSVGRCQLLSDIEEIRSCHITEKERLRDQDPSGPGPRVGLEDDPLIAPDDQSPMTIGGCKDVITVSISYLSNQSRDGLSPPPSSELERVSSVKDSSLEASDDSWFLHSIEEEGDSKSLPEAIFVSTEGDEGCPVPVSEHVNDEQLIRSPSSASPTTVQDIDALSNPTSSEPNQTDTSLYCKQGMLSDSVSYSSNHLDVLTSDGKLRNDDLKTKNIARADDEAIGPSICCTISEAPDHLASGIDEGDTVTQEDECLASQVTTIHPSSAVEFISPGSIDRVHDDITFQLEYDTSHLRRYSPHHLRPRKFSEPIMRSIEGSLATPSDLDGAKTACHDHIKTTSIPEGSSSSLSEEALSYGGEDLTLAPSCDTVDGSIGGHGNIPEVLVRCRSVQSSEEAAQTTNTAPPSVPRARLHFSSVSPSLAGQFLMSGTSPHHCLSNPGDGDVEAFGPKVFDLEGQFRRVDTVHIDQMTSPVYMARSPTHDGIGRGPGSLLVVREDEREVPMYEIISDAGSFDLNEDDPVAHQKHSELIGVRPAAISSLGTPLPTGTILTVPSPEGPQKLVLNANVTAFPSAPASNNTVPKGPSLQSSAAAVLGNASTACDRTAVFQTVEPWMQRRIDVQKVYLTNQGDQEYAILFDCRRFGLVKNPRIEGTMVMTSPNAQLFASLQKGQDLADASHAVLTKDPPLLGDQNSFYWPPLGYYNLPSQLTKSIKAIKEQKSIVTENTSQLNHTDMHPKVVLGPTGHWYVQADHLVWEVPESMAAELTETIQNDHRCLKSPPTTVSIGSYNPPSDSDKRSHQHPGHAIYISWIIIWKDGTYAYSGSTLKSDEESDEEICQQPATTTTTTTTTTAKEDGTKRTTKLGKTGNYYSCKLIPCRPPRALLILLENLTINELRAVKNINLGPSGQWVLIRGDNSVAADGLPPHLMLLLQRISQTDGRLRRLEFGSSHSGDLTWSIRFWVPELPSRRIQRGTP